MEKLSWPEQYRHPLWQKKRLEVMEDAGFACENCGDASTTLNVHQKRYVKGRQVWEYTRDELQCLCESCHLKHHSAKDQLAALIAKASPGVLSDMAALVAGYLEGLCYLDETPSVPEGHSHLYEVGLLASMFDGRMPDSLYRAACADELQHLSPEQSRAKARWLEFKEQLEDSGL